jgi:hypothetical protein
VSSGFSLFGASPIAVGQSSEPSLDGTVWRLAATSKRNVAWAKGRRRNEKPSGIFARLYKSAHPRSSRTGGGCGGFGSPASAAIRGSWGSPPGTTGSASIHLPIAFLRSAGAVLGAYLGRVVKPELAPRVPVELSLSQKAITR